LRSEGNKLPEYGNVVNEHATEQRPLTSVSTRQQHIAKIAKKYANSALNTLNHHLDLLWMREAYQKINTKSAVGVDGQSVADYGKNLDENVKDLLERAKSGRYRARAVRRVHIPKNERETRAIGIPTTENKVLERAVAMLLEPIYETDFKEGSYGFRPNRSAHDALESIREFAMEMKGCWVIDADIRKYFDTIPHDRLRTILRQRVEDGVILRLIGKWLKSGIMEQGQLSYSDQGTPQGGVISPLLSNIYLHEVLDKWFEEVKLNELRVKAKLVRFADDFVLLVENHDDALKLMNDLPQRFEEYGLSLHSEKTKLVDFRHPWKSGGKPETFDFLGFTHYWGKTRKAGFAMKKKTSSSKQRKSLSNIHQWCKKYRHRPIKWQHGRIVSKLLGHYGYYAVRGNYRSLSIFQRQVRKTWRYWLNQRSRKADGMKWARYDKLTSTRFVLPSPRIVHHDQQQYQLPIMF